MSFFGPSVPQYGTPGINPAANAPQEPFQWGRGGQRLTPDDLLFQRRLAATQMAQGADFSPVQHWTQGAARALTGLAGGLNMRRADKAADANASESQAVMQALLAGGNAAEGQPDPVAAALANPNVSPEVRELATMMWRDQHENAAQPFRPEDNAGNIWEMGPDGEFRLIFTDRAPKQFLQDGQLVTVQNPYDGGMPVSSSGPPPEAVAELRANPGMISEFDEVFGPGAAARALSPAMATTPAPEAGANGQPAALTREQYNAVVTAKGQAATDAWMQRNGIAVRGN